MLDEWSSRAALDDAAASLYERLASIHPLADRADTLLPSGRALSPAAAANCTRDGMRLAMFLRGLRDAIACFERPEVVYAGTGPFAPFAISFLDRARFTLIDIHEESVRSVRAIVDHFGSEATVLVADATQYKHPKPIDIAVCEAMQKALTVEPQVEIARNLASQLSADGIVVPQCIAIDLDPGGVRIVELDRGVLNAHTVTVPLSGHAVYRTTIRTYGRHILRDSESGLTHPERVSDLRVRNGERIAFSYETGERPGIRWKRLRPLD